MDHTVIATLNKVRVLRREDGKFGVEDMIGESIAWRFRSEDGAMTTAKSMSEENDRIDAHNAKFSEPTADAPALKVTDIQIFGGADFCPDEWSANIAINDKWMIQRGTDGGYSIPHSDLATWKGEEAQDAAREAFNPDQVAEDLDLDALLEEAKADKRNWI